MLSSLTTEIATFGGQTTQKICQSTTESDCVQILSMFLHRSKFFRTKWCGTLSNGCVINYLIHYKVYFQPMVLRRTTSKSKCNSLQTKTQGVLPAQVSRLSLSWREERWPWKAISTSSICYNKKIRDPPLEEIFLIFCKWFYLLFLEDLIHTFRIRWLLCKLISIWTEDKQKVRFWREFGHMYWLLIIIQSQSSFATVIRLFIHLSILYFV